MGGFNRLLNQNQAIVEIIFNRNLISPLKRLLVCWDGRKIEFTHRLRAAMVQAGYAVSPSVLEHEFNLRW